MEPREMDALIAEKVMGWVWLTRSCYDSQWLGPSLEIETARLGDGQECLGKIRLVDEGLGDGKKYRESVNTMKGEVVVPAYTADPKASRQLRLKLAERFDYTLNDWVGDDGRQVFWFALYEKGSRTGVPLFKAEADSEEMAVALCAMRAMEGE